METPAGENPLWSNLGAGVRLKSKVPWFRVFAEGIVIVGSILLAFGIDAAWEQRAERLAEQEALAGLVGDFRNIEADLVSGGNLAARQAEWIERLIESPSDALADTAEWALTVTSTYEPAESTLDGLIASGQLSLLTDEVLRRSLNSWRNQLDEIQDNERVMRDYDLRTMVPYLAREAGSARGSTSESFLLDLSENGEFQFLARTKAGWMRSAAEEYEQALGLVREILARIDERPARR